MNASFLHSSWVSNDESGWVHDTIYKCHNTILYEHDANARAVLLCLRTMVNRFKSEEEYNTLVGAYDEFLRTASEWLSRSVTNVCTSQLVLVFYIIIIIR